MTNEWQEFLTDHGAHIADSGLVAFPGDKQPALNALCVLSGQVILRVTGDDATDFLQGQFSNDVAALAVPGSQLTTWSSPKGRVLSLFRLYRDDGGYLIVLPAALANSFVKRLRMYVLMAKVVVEEQPQMVSLGFSGSAAATLLAGVIGSVPPGIDACVSKNDILAAKVRGEHGRYEVIAPLEFACEHWPAWSAVCQPAGETVWRLQNIDAGVPSIGSDTTEAFVLQMLNLQHINGVSFKKGCFPGQEVVARMQYLGKLKRRMYLAYGSQSGDSVPQPGDDIFQAQKSSAVGKVVDAQPTGDGGYRMLVVLAIAAADSPLYLEPEAQQGVDLLDLPYSIES